MIYTDATKKAMIICFQSHKDQVDKSGIPYVFHPIHLAEQMQDEDTTIVALLHDVVEDTDYTLDDLAEMGFQPQVIEAIGLMTHPKDVPYMDYVAKIKDNPIAKAVKLADLTHNSDLSRLDFVDDKSKARLDKYKSAINLLSD
ncbi:MAG: bifunctional (p)ppGpp synthetase/guanosine-3',5'-bis(diphosphate) 3'-pyrophosphohydrolase [Oscillospiraceae bacterium]|nr:bifunctional (p)ppGpp synthetase/guanosine-3',5'-bis(diphosphate) 3'-pyrophosphohydrolase [Oscillospiraceae bacterium]